MANPPRPSTVHVVYEWPQRQENHGVIFHSELLLKFGFRLIVVVYFSIKSLFTLLDFFKSYLKCKIKCIISFVVIYTKITKVTSRQDLTRKRAPKSAEILLVKYKTSSRVIICIVVMLHRSYYLLHFYYYSSISKLLVFATRNDITWYRYSISLKNSSSYFILG